MEKNGQAAALKARITDCKGASLGLSERIELAADLAGLILEGALKEQTAKEQQKEADIGRMIADVRGKACITQILDSAFRSQNPKRVIDQISYIVSVYGIPSFLSRVQKAGVWLFTKAGKIFPQTCLHALNRFVRHQVEEVIAPGEDDALYSRLQQLKSEHVQINLNRLGEAILGEQEAQKRLEQNIRDLKNPDIDVISVKISSIASQINVVAFTETLDRLKIALRRLYRASKEYNKFVNLDMEEYKDLHLTVRLFQEVLDEPEFLSLSAGIALQSYIPDSYTIQESLTTWAIKRCKMGGAPIKIRIVKGANLGMERVEASLREWRQAPYLQKKDADANFKKMLHYGTKYEHASAVHLGIGSHNLFDIAYALVLASENGIEPYVHIEMLAGMVPHIARFMPKIWNNVLLYLPAAKKDEFHNAIAYLMRRLDENTAPNNFLTHMFGLQVPSEAWEEQKELFITACQNADSVSTAPRRIEEHTYINEPDTDFSLPKSHAYTQEILKEWRISYHEIGLVVAGHHLVSSELAQGIDPSRPGCKIYTYFLAQEYQVNVALECAKNHGPLWADIPLFQRITLLKKVASNLRQTRQKLTGAMMQEVAKSIPEADAEISEAIDFVDYYIKEAESHAHAERLFSVGKASLVLTPWNFPISIPTSALVSSLISGYSVIFKPAPEAILCGWLLAQCFWQAGISKEVLQFIACKDDPIGTMLVKDPRIDIVILTGGTSTARNFLNWRPTLKLFAETGGKNSLIVSTISDRDLAVKDAVHSAFTYSGQKCSALSLLILEEEVYNSESFRRQLVDAASSLRCGKSYDPASVVTPLIRPPSNHLMRALTTLEDGESWLLEPRLDPNNPHAVTPGIKLGVRPGSFMHTTELFGPVLAVMKAKNLVEAIELANSTPYGLTAGIHTLDPREQEYWKTHILAGNCYINRPITGAIVARQPFGGCKASSFGLGMKVGGPNYLLELANTHKIPPQGLHEIPKELMELESALLQLGAKREATTHFYKACCSYAFWWDNYFSKPRTLRRLVGEDNILEFRGRDHLFILIHDHDPLTDIMLLFACAKLARCKVHCGASFKMHRRLFRQGPLAPLFKKYSWTYGLEEETVSLILNTPQAHVRAITMPPPDVLEEIKETLGSLDVSHPSSNGRLELIHYLREVATSYDYHRYGSLMARETEAREPVQ